MAVRKIIIGAVTAVVVATFSGGVALADHDDGFYKLPVNDHLAKSDLDVFIVPPNHGQIYNEHGALNGNDPAEAGPFNSYLRAIEDSIQAWNDAIERFGSERLKELYVADVYVIGRDDLPQQAEPDVMVVTGENSGPMLGVAARAGEPCVVNNSKMFVQSFTYADMYNVNAQEYGHCLGLGHVGDTTGQAASEDMHPAHDVMNGLYAHEPGRKNTHLHCLSNLDITGLEYAFQSVEEIGDTFMVRMPVKKYRTTCGRDGRPAPENA